MNKVFLTGNLGADAELRTFDNGGSVLNFSLATTESWKNKETGEKESRTEWHRCKLFGKRAESLAGHLLKGTKLAVEGSINYGSYEKDGVTKYTTDIKVNNVEFLGGGKSKEEAPREDNDASWSDADELKTDEIPF